VNFMILKVAPSLCAINFLNPVRNSSVLLQEVSRRFVVFFDPVKVALVFSFLNSQSNYFLDILDNRHNMENRDIDGSHDKEMEVNDIEERQCMIN